MRFNYLFEKPEDMIDIHVKSANMTYSIPRKTWNQAVEDFNQEYKGSNALEIAKKIARKLMPSTHEDPYREERLLKCLLSQKGKIGNIKKIKPSGDKQQKLFDT